MSTIDLSKIKPGDRVRIRYMGLEGWQDVTFGIGGESLVTMPGRFLLGGVVEILEHEPTPRKIEVELPAPEPGKWYCEGGAPGDWVGATGEGLFVRVDLQEQGATRQEVYLSPARAEAFALRALSIARSLREDS